MRTRSVRCVGHTGSQRSFPVVVPEDVVWKPPGRYGGPAWTGEMPRAWVTMMGSVEGLTLVWRVCTEPGPPGVRGQVRPAYAARSLLSTSHLI